MGHRSKSAVAFRKRQVAALVAFAAASQPSTRCSVHGLQLLDTLEFDERFEFALTTGRRAADGVDKIQI